MSSEVPSLADAESRRLTRTENRFESLAGAPAGGLVRD
jgi:hypothetical protein